MQSWKSNRVFTSKEELETLKDIVIKHDLFLFADEIESSVTMGTNTILY